MYDPQSLTVERSVLLPLNGVQSIAVDATGDIFGATSDGFLFRCDTNGQLEAYMEKLLAAFNPAAAAGVMCRSLISVGHDGRVYDCDFNQMLELDAVDEAGRALSIFDFNIERLLKRKIRFDEHCLGCTAGAGSSCGGATA